MKPPPKEPTMPVPFRLTAPAGGWKPITIRSLHVLVSPLDGGQYVGRCLEHNVSVQGPTFAALADALSHVILTQCLLDQSAGVEMLSTLPKALDEYWDAWHSALPQVVPGSSVKVALHDSAFEARLTMDFALVQCAGATA